MKKFLILAMVLACFAGTAHADLTYGQANYKRNISSLHSASGNDPLYNFIGEVEAILGGSSSSTVTSILFSLETSNPSDTTEGRLYYNTNEEAFKYRKSGSWATIAAESGTVSLDIAYNNGNGIDVDGSPVTLTVSDTDNNAALVIAQNDNTNDPDGITVTMGSNSTGTAIEIDSQATGTDIAGDNWSVDQTGGATFAGNMTITGTSYDIEFDVSRNLLHFLDNAILGIGGATTETADVTMSHDGSDFSLLSKVSDEGFLIGGTSLGFDITYAFKTAGQIRTDYDDDFLNFTDDMDLRFGTGVSADGDFMISSDSANLLTIDVVVAGSGSIAIGNDADDVPFKWFGETTGNYIAMTGDQLHIEGGATGAQLALGDGDAILLGDTLGTGDFSISDVSDVLLIQNVVDGTGTVAFGASNLGIDVAFWGDAGTGQMLWDENANTNGALIFDNADIEMGDDDFIQLGDGADLTIVATGTTTTATMAAGSVFIFADTDDVASLFTFGTTVGNGLDVLFLGVTSGDIVDWDAGADTWNFGVNATGVDVFFYGDSASAFMKWDESDDQLVIAGGGTISLNDAVALLVGTGASNAGDFEIFSTNGSTLTIDTVVPETGDVEFGVTNLGIDVQLWAATGAEGVLWDASDETLEFVGSNIEMDSASVITVHAVVQVDQVVTDAANYSVLAANSGKIHMIADLTQNTTIKLPTEADGLNYEFWYIGDAADTHDHNITSEDVTNFYIGGVSWLDSGNAIASVYSNGTANYILTIPNMAGGTIIKMTCDGVHWYVTGTVVSDTTPTMTGA